MMERLSDKDFDINFKEIKQNIASAAEKSGRKAEDVILLAATKTVEVERINYAISEGLEYIGENRVQEFLSKKDELLPCHRHFIGHLQTNKVKDIVPFVELIHSVDSVRLAKEISKQSVRFNKTTDILLEVNVGNEQSKSGFLVEIAKIEIERDEKRVRLHIHCAKPGMVIGRNGSEIEKLRETCQNMLSKPVVVNIVEIKNPDANAQLVAENIAVQLEKRISFRRAMKLAIGRAMRLGIKGIKTQVSGRLGGAEIARSERYHEGTIPLQTLRADIDYGFAEADTTYGKIGVKVWIYKGEVLNENRRTNSKRGGAR